MATRKIVVQFVDGTEEWFNPNRPRLLYDLEKKFKVQAPETHEQLCWVAHRALAKDVPFDEWLDTVEEFFPEGDDDDQGDKSEDETGKDQS